MNQMEVIVWRRTSVTPRGSRLARARAASSLGDEGSTRGAHRRVNAKHRDERDEPKDSARTSSRGGTMLNLRDRGQLASVAVDLGPTCAPPHPRAHQVDEARGCADAIADVAVSGSSRA